VSEELDEFDNADAAGLLRLAIEKSERLVGELRANQAEVEADPPDLPPEQLAEGKIALQNAIASAERALEALRAAAAVDTGTTSGNEAGLN
jgi:hypothetical protein